MSGNENPGSEGTTPQVWACGLGRVAYTDALALQNRICRARQRGEIPDVLLLLEHFPVYTKGRRSDPAELPMGEEWYRLQGIDIAQSDRGGRVTYHGPGQLVAYPIVDLGPYDNDVVAHVQRMEALMAAALAPFGVDVQLFDGLTGVWTAGDPPIPIGAPGPQGTAVAARGVQLEAETAAAKIGSIGVHVSRGVTTHGLAVNINADLQPFEYIHPCGMEYCRMTSLARELGAEQEMGEVAEHLVAGYAEIFEREVKELDPGQLDALVPRED